MPGLAKERSNPAMNAFQALVRAAFIGEKLPENFFHFAFPCKIVRNPLWHHSWRISCSGGIGWKFVSVIVQFEIFGSIRNNKWVVNNLTKTTMPLLQCCCPHRRIPAMVKKGQSCELNWRNLAKLLWNLWAGMHWCRQWWVLSHGHHQRVGKTPRWSN